ncbi:MAG: GGDEF domain-containing protein [Sphingomonas sp.]|nr:GGDEF domain-containing protein [Sphingomonas sp.]
MAERSDLTNASEATELERLREENRALRQRIGDLDAMAHEDSLLQVPNRRGLMREVARFVSRATRYGESAALLFLDFDGLKAINDSHGHCAGDAALTHVTRLLGDALRASDVIGRYGGDEFCVLLAHVEEEKAQETARRLEAAVAASDFTYEGRPVPLAVTIGITMVREDDDPNALLDRADKDMYARKD